MVIKFNQHKFIWNITKFNLFLNLCKFLKS